MHLATGFGISRLPSFSLLEFQMITDSRIVLRIHRPFLKFHRDGFLWPMTCCTSATSVKDRDACISQAQRSKMKREEAQVIGCLILFGCYAHRVDCRVLDSRWLVFTSALCCVSFLTGEHKVWCVSSPFVSSHRKTISRVSRKCNDVKDQLFERAQHLYRCRSIVPKSQMH